MCCGRRDAAANVRSSDPVPEGWRCVSSGASLRRSVPAGFGDSPFAIATVALMCVKCFLQFADLFLDSILLVQPL